MLDRKRRIRGVLAPSTSCAHEMRGPVAVAAAPEASHDARPAAACRRAKDAVEALADGRPDRLTLTVHAASATHPAWAHLHSPEQALTEPSRPLRPRRGGSAPLHRSTKGPLLLPEAGPFVVSGRHAHAC
ncbi:hypothetical protein [Streptomyces sp. BK239]|uniref:hypothetical protein n=1 Tax=Streptomyces sp. BK239 TaxID=2512155 RepID=UPI00102BC78D|nr:hypothetical protein [Streptomyces sp. BK239]